MSNKLFLTGLSLLLCTACDMIDYHPYDSRTGGISDTNQKNIERIEAICVEKTTFRFALTGDTQRQYNDTEDMVRHMNSLGNIDFVVHGGDISDFGVTKEFKWQHDILSKLSMPFVTLIGNHDVLGNGYQVYRSMFGPENFSFMAGNCKFVCLNTNAIEYDYSTPVPDFIFIENEINDSRERECRTIVAMHAPPLGEQFNNNVAKVFQEYVKKFSGLLCCLHAHEHNYNVRDLFDDGVLYYGCSSVGKRNYLVFTVTPEGYTHEVVNF